MGLTRPRPRSGPSLFLLAFSGETPRPARTSRPARTPLLPRPTWLTSCASSGNSMRRASDGRRVLGQEVRAAGPPLGVAGRSRQRQGARTRGGWSGSAESAPNRLLLVAAWGPSANQGAGARQAPGPDNVRSPRWCRSQHLGDDRCDVVIGGAVVGDAGPQHEAAAHGGVREVDPSKPVHTL